MKHEESKQTMWETWFVISIILLLVMLFTGNMKGSSIFFPNWPYFAIGVVVNLIVCIRIGTRVPKETEKDNKFKSRCND